MVSFWHPGARQLLLRLCAYDVYSDNVFGLHHGTALLACQILAYNRLGYLSTSHDPTDISSRHAGGRDTLLLHMKYFYHVVPEPQYKVCRQFSEWPFPHKSFEEIWGSGPLNVGVSVELECSDGASAVIKQRDRVCPISGCDDSLRMAHIIPVSKQAWVRD
jgi:hypothetical protein